MQLHNKSKVTKSLSLDRQDHNIFHWHGLISMDKTIVTIHNVGAITRPVVNYQGAEGQHLTLVSNNIIYTPLQKKRNTWFCGIPDLKIGSTSLREQNVVR